MKKTSKTRDAGGEELWSSILTSFRDTATRSNRFKVIRTRARPISARVTSMGDLLCLFTGAPASGRGWQETTQRLCPWCERCLLITESPRTPSHYRYLIWVLVYISYTGVAVFSFAIWRVPVYTAISNFWMFVFSTLQSRSCWQLTNSCLRRGLKG